MTVKATMALPPLLYDWQRPWGTMTGVLSENMAANHLILISLCSGETADMRGETCGGEELGKWTQLVQVLHTHHSEGQWSIAFSLPHNMVGKRHFRLYHLMHCLEHCIEND